MIILVSALVVPVYPKQVLSIYAVNHILFLVGLSYLCPDNTVIVKQFNSSTTMLVAVILFLLLHRYNVTNFLNEEMLKEDKRTFIKLFETNPFPLLISRFADGKILYANDKAVLFYELSEKIPGDFNCAHLYNCSQDFNNIRDKLEADGKLSDYFVEQKTLSGQTKYAVVNYELIDYFGEKSILSGVADIGEIRRIERTLAVYATTDALTGVLNRRAGMDLLKARFEAARNGKMGFILCFFDVDNLKMVNDTFGHLEGDAMIIDICGGVTKELQPGDVIFRYGGDEFMIIFENSYEQEVGETCARIARRFKALNQSKQKPYWLDASFGVFSYKPEMELSLEQIIEIVDKDMYHNKAKKAGLLTQAVRKEAEE
jgi:diguanylate cyclase (GGDEF)-like protein